MKANLIRKNLILKGAEPALVWLFVSCAALFESVTKHFNLSKPEDNHILPKAVWPQFKDEKWNHAEIAWGLHAALHWILVILFPDNPKIRKAVTAVRIGRHGRRLDGRANEVKLCAKQGLSVAEAARKMNVRYSLLSAWAKGNGIKFQKHRSKCDRHIDNIKKWAGEGFSITEIARKIDIDTSALYYWVHMSKHDDIKFVSAAHRKKLDSRRDEIIKYINQGLTVTCVARKLNVTINTLRRWSDTNSLIFKKAKRLSIFDINRAKVLDFIKRGYSPSGIAQQFNRSDEALRAWLKANPEIAA